jgi:hypothetical protein
MIFENYLNNLINFAGDAITEMEEIEQIFNNTKIIFFEFAEKLGEKKTAKVKEVLDPIYTFCKSFVI